MVGDYEEYRKYGCLRYPLLKVGKYDLRCEVVIVDDDDELIMNNNQLRIAGAFMCR